MSENIPYIIAEDGYYYVAYKEKAPVPEIVVSAKGVANGLSEEYNDGWDFGPDSYSPTSTSAIPYTETIGVQEAGNYLIANGGGTMFLNGNLFYIDVSIQFLADTSITIIGKSLGESPPFIGTVILPSSSFSGNQLLSYFTPTLNSGTMEIQKVLFYGNSSQSINGIDNGTVPSGYSQFPQTKLKDVGFGGFNMAFQIESTGGPNILEDIIIYYSNNVIVNNASTHITSIEFYECGASGINIFNSAGGTTIVDNMLMISAIGGVDISNSGDLLINTLEIQSGSENSIFAPSSGHMNIGTVIIDSMANGYLLNLSSPTIYAKIHDIMMILSEDYTTGLINYNSSLDYSSSLIEIDGVLVITNGYTFAIGSMPPDYVPTINIHPKSLLTPTLSANPPVSATVYQNTNPYDIEIDLPVYASTSGTAGYVTLAKGSTDTPSSIGNQYVSGDTSDTSEQIIRLRVPAGWYYSFTASGVTFTTASVFAE